MRRCYRIEPFHSLIAILSASLFVISTGAAPAATFYVSPHGNDGWSGGRKTPNGPKSDGPLATLEGARDAIRKLKGNTGLKEPVTVLIEPGFYARSEPFVLEPQDSGTDAFPITYRGEGEKRPVISGGVPISGFIPPGAGKDWTAPLPEAAAGKWSFGSLWVNGERRTLARTPNEGFFHVVGKAASIQDAATGKEVPQENKAFRFKPGDIKDWGDLNHILVVVYHNWEISIHRIASVDSINHIVTFTGSAPWAIGAGQRYFVESVPEALDSPGEWYLDQKGWLSYIPLKGENLSTGQVIAPVAKQLILLNGNPRENQFVDHLHFENLALMYTDYTIEPQGHADGQAAFSVPAAVQMTGARNCSVERCEIAHTSNYAVWFRSGCQQDRIIQTEMHDLGAGGVRIGEGGNPETPAEAAGHCTVENNFIHDCSKIFEGAVGVWIGRSSDNTVSHNDIGDMDYTGISVGWSWGYDPSSANHNILEFNHIHDIGRGVMSDMGAIYSLGVSPGTVERGNLMHDIYCYPPGYGGWGVYTDEGSSNILVENNLVYNTSSGCFHQHYGQDNLLQNNIFAYGIEGVLRRTREETHNSFTFQHNLVVSNGSPFQIAGWSNGYYTLDHNLYWNYEDPRPSFYGMSFAEWQAKGHDTHSLIADPLFAGHPPSGKKVWPEASLADFRLKPGSPAEQVGFKPFPYMEAGLYGDRAWVSLPGKVKRARYSPPPPPPPTPIAEGFEDTPVGQTPDGASTFEEAGKGDSIRVTDETAASGKHSLKLTDAPGLERVFNPHFYYSPNWTTGPLQEDFDIRIEPGAIFNHEWRDAANPYHVGPHFDIGENGDITVGDRTIGKVIPGQWMHISLSCQLGKEARGKFNLSLKAPGEENPHSLTDLPCSPDFRSLNWLGYVMNGDKHAIVYLDSINLWSK